MIKIDKVEVVGWEPAIRGMRNPMNSWDKSDSGYCDGGDCKACAAYEKLPKGNEMCTQPFLVGPNDRDLMLRLRNAGTDHRKYLRMIVVYADITAPLYWWKEYDTYKVGTVANSCSTMHKIHEKEFTLEDFSCEYLLDLKTASNSKLFLWTPGNIMATPPYGVLVVTVEMLNRCRELYLELSKMSKDEWKTAPKMVGLENCSLDEAKKIIWWQMIQLLPSSYNQKRTVMLNYEVLINMYKSRKFHKLDEWREFCKWIESLPFSELITGDVPSKSSKESED